MHSQIESGSLCPTNMTQACIPVLQKEPALYERIGAELLARDHDARDLPAEQKTSITVGMGMTEKQGGSDVRANTTRAVSLRGEGRGAEYPLTGHKWFFSAPMCDAHRCWPIPRRARPASTCRAGGPTAARTRSRSSA